VLIVGPSGSGKSDLVLRLLDRGADLVSDDYSELRADAGRLLASPPARIAGKLEVRGVGIVEVPFTREAPVALLVDLDRSEERLPEPDPALVAGVSIPAIGLSALEASAPLKLEMALEKFGLSLS
jgi:serine kinase of HPr protein (carbohydrate metabolism regulator)